MYEKPSYIPSYSLRVKYSRKIRDTEKEIAKLKQQGDWNSVTYLTWQLRNKWWGYKKYSK